MANVHNDYQGTIRYGRLDPKVLAAEIHGPLELLLIRRSIPPYQNFLALPGGFVRIDEEIEEEKAADNQEFCQ